MIIEKLRVEDKPVVQLIGGVATKNAFHVFDTATNEQLISTICKVREMQGASAWWLGDLGLAIQDRKRAELAAQVKELRDKAVEMDGSLPEQANVKNELLERADELDNGAEVKYTAELCSALGIDVGYLKNCVSLARFYPPSLRNDGLTVEHHIAAMRGAKRDGAKIQEVLKQAKVSGQSASELRKSLAEESATHRPPVAQPETDEFEALGRANKWATGYKSKAATLTPQLATQILEQATELRSLLSQLESIAKGMS